MTFVRVGNVIFDRDRVVLIWQQDRDVLMHLDGMADAFRFEGPEAGEVWRLFDPDPGWRENSEPFPNLK